jgi:hypothetical protein
MFQFENTVVEKTMSPFSRRKRKLSEKRKEKFGKAEKCQKEFICAAASLK